MFDSDAMQAKCHQAVSQEILNPTNVMLHAIYGTSGEQAVRVQKTPHTGLEGGRAKPSWMQATQSVLGLHL